MNGLKRKLEKLHEEEKVLHQHSRKRIQHLQHLYQIHSLVDVQYDIWSRIRLNRLLVDYLLRGGYSESAKVLAREMGIEELVDLDVFVGCHAIEESLRRGSTQECLAWCVEHKHMMKKVKVRKVYFLLVNNFMRIGGHDGDKGISFDIMSVMGGICSTWVKTE